MFVNIVHTTAFPAIVVGQGKVITRALADGISRFADRALYPDIVVIISIRVPQYNEDIELAGGVLGPDGELYPGFEAAGPFLTGDDHVLFKKIGRKGAGRPLDAAGGQEKQKGLFQ